jgi:CspA family cold shock protein
VQPYYFAGFYRLISLEEMVMSDELRVIECQRCGRGFVLTETHLNMLARRRVKVVIPLVCPTCFYKAGTPPKRQGEVKWFDERKHYGFIVTEEGEEVFFHERQIVEDGGGETDQGHTVRFHTRQGAKGVEALNVELIDREGQ